MKESGFRGGPVWAAAMHSLRWLGPVLPARVYSHLWFRGRFRAKVGAARFHMRHSGGELENQVFWKNSFTAEHGTVLTAARQLGRVRTFLDVGANSGFFSLLARALNPSAKVIAVEPSPANLEILRENARLNGSSITIVEAAATSTDGEVVLHDFDDVSYSASLEGGWREGTVERRVRGVTLDSLAREQGFDGEGLLVKIDVEGHEAGVLAGAGALIAQRPAFLVEIIRDNVAAAVAGILDPAVFDFALIDEASGSTSDRTAAFRDGIVPEYGNYLITPRPAGGA